MKKYFYLFLIALCSGVVFSSCSDDDDELYIVDENWQADNEKVFAQIVLDPEYTKLESQSNGGSIYYKVLEAKSPNSKPSDETIYYTSNVKVHYFGISMDVTSRKMEYEFDSADYPYKDPATFTVSGVVDGFSTALQHMHPGDRWEIWIPWQLGYGSTGNRNASGQQTLPWPHSTLKFEVEVIEIVK